MSPDRLLADLEAEGELDVCLSIKCPYLVFPWLPPDRRDIALLDALAPCLNEVGRRCRQHGLTVAYHNHDVEVAQSEGAYWLDRLLDATDPERVGLELDVYWAAFAGIVPAVYVRRHTGRVPLVHLKVLSAERSFSKVGEATLDFTSIVWRKAARAGTSWRTTGPRWSAQRSLQNLWAMGT